MHIACSADSRFAADCAVMLSSLLATNKWTTPTIHFLHDDCITAEELGHLERIVHSNGGMWSPVQVPSQMTAIFPFSERYGYSAWYRILLPNILPDLNRVLYLDSDLLILKSLRPLWEYDLGQNACLAAVTQPTLPSMLPRLQSTLGLPDAKSYFNSGVMVLDLDRIRQGNFIDEVLAFIDERRGPMPWADQDPLNAVLHERCVALAPRWNAMTPIYHHSARKLPFTLQEVREAKSDPAIVHFIGPFKPWHYRTRHPYRKRYFEYLALTPWKDKALEGRTRRHMLLRPWPPRWQPHIESVLNRATKFVRRRP